MQHHDRQDKMRKTALSGLLAVFLSTGVMAFTLLASAPSVNAQAADPLSPVIAAGTTQSAIQATAQTGLQAKTSIWDGIKIGLANVAALALLNAGQYFVQRLAYDTANYIASGGQGQKPLFITEGVGKYVENTALDAAGEALGSITQSLANVKGLEGLGINLCSPTDPRIALNIKLGFLANIGRFAGGQPQPKCSWNQVSSNWDRFASQNSDQVLSQVGVMFSDSGQTPLGAALEFNRYSLNLMSAKQQAAVNNAFIGQGFKNVVDKISGQVKTPATVVADEMKSTGQLAKNQQLMNVQITGDAFKAGAYGVLSAGLQTFTNTLAQKLMQKLFTKGLISIKGLFSSGSSASSPLTNASAIVSAGTTAAQLSNADLLTPKIFSTTNYDALLDFTSCPNGSLKSPYNCVMDSQLFAAVNRAADGAPLTLQQAVRQGFVNGSWRLLPLSHPKSTDPNCYLQAFCYGNLTKMRAARVIPIGWEMAANSPFNDLNNPVTLQEAMDHFNDCAFKTDVNGEQVLDTSRLPDPQHPWCRLVDPNWVLKYPKAICQQQGPGAQLLASQSNVRASLCVDAPSCINQDAKGNCTSGYGYCVRERNAWSIDADSCDAQYAGCQALTRSDGQQSSFMLNTVNAASCNAGNAGCTGRSTVKNAVPNGGFESVILNAATDWTTNGASGIEQSVNAYHGDVAGYVTSGASLTTDGDVLPGQPYVLGTSTRAGQANVGTQALVTVAFLDQNGILIAGTCNTTKTNGIAKTCNVGADCDSGDTCTKVVINQDCQAAQAIGSTTLTVPASDLGYQSGSCNVTVPPTAFKAHVTVRGAAISGRLYVDDVGLYGASYSSSPFDSAFLNGRAASCNSDKVGCTQLVRASSANLNIVRNPGFEDRTVDGQTPTFWVGVPAANYLVNTSQGFEGAAAISLPGGTVSQDVFGALPDAAYAFSVYSKGGSGAVAIYGYDVNGTLLSQSGGGQNLCQVAGGGAAATLPLASGASYQQTSCVITVPSAAAKLRVAFTGNGTFVDGIQLQLGATATSFHQGYDSNAERLSMKVAPPGVSCTGGVSDPPSCQNFAKSCARADVGCALYSPVDGGAALPAVTSPSDACPAECNGYAAFREEPTAFTGSTFPVPFVPNTATSCSAAQAGCQEFTNLEKLAQGGESREYFTKIRLCQKPDDQTTSYYTWEGNDLNGFQLRVWPLRQSNIASGASLSDPTGGVAPCTNLQYNGANQPICQDTPATIATCTKDTLQYNPDCREFYDQAGNIHYRLNSRTILSSDQCTEYRMTSAVQADCTTHGGMWIRNECHYFGYGPENVACAATANNCRAYTGNASRNLRIAVTTSFEDGTTDNWLPNDPTKDAPSNESVSASGHSLKITTGQISQPLRQNGAYLVNSGRSYLVSFWAKGSGNITPVLVPAAGQTLPFPPVGLTTDWQRYEVGPVAIVGTLDTTAALQLNITPASTDVRPVFIDNFQLTEISDSIYAIKGSWKTPASCDQDQNGNASPQYMLGCKAYKTQTGTQSYFKSFERLCRQEAIGCDAFYNTQNSESPFSETWNASCLLGQCVPKAGETSCPCQTAGQTVCNVVAGGSQCYYNSKGDVPASDVSTFGDTVRIKADAMTYLIDDKKFYCDNSDAGCSEMAKPITNGQGTIIQSWQTTYLKNQPASYAQILCTQPENACEAWQKAEDGTPVYFKDPGNRTCEYRTDVTVTGVKSSGWFRNGSDTPCDPTYLLGGNQYGLWKNADGSYDNWVGSCPASSSMCKEFRDTSDLSADFPQGRPYYYIQNSRLDAAACAGQVSRVTSPSGATEASACVLFQQADEVGRSFATTPSYALSEKQFGALVSPVDEASVTHASGNANVGVGAGQCGDGKIDVMKGEECDLGRSENTLGVGCSTNCLLQNDANIILRVTHDRQCGEWLDCRSSQTVFNPSTGAFQHICTAFGLCTQYRKVGDTTQCIKYADDSYHDQVLNDAIYAARATGWSAEEYSGDAVPFRYPIEQLQTINVAAAQQPSNPRLVYVAPKVSCSGNFTECGTPNNLGNRGTCINGACVWPIDGSAPVQSQADLQQISAKTSYPAASCRIYPREDSPFPGSVADPGGWDQTVTGINDGNPRLIGPSPAFQGANVCQRRVLNISHCSNNPSLLCDPSGSSATSIAAQCGNISASCTPDSIAYDSCECGYIQAKYGNDTTKYFPLNGPDIPNGYCNEGVFQGLECDPTATGLRDRANLSCCSKLGAADPETGLQECETDGNCQAISKTDYLVGSQGQCLERDFSTPINGTSDQFACANWRPTGLVGGALDIYNLNRTAGYFAPADRRFYCAEPLPTQGLIAGSSGKFFNKPVGYNLNIPVLPTSEGKDFTFRVCDNSGRVGDSNSPPWTPCTVKSDCDLKNVDGTPSSGNCIAHGVCVDAAGNRTGNNKCGPINNNGGCGGVGNCVPPVVSGTTLTELNNQGPANQPGNRFFGPGKVNLMVPRFMSNWQSLGVNDWCAAAADVGNGASGYAWCLFPTTAERCIKTDNVTTSATGQTQTPAVSGTCTDDTVFSMQTPVAQSITGCYEVSDNNIPSNSTVEGPPTIEWPYLGPAIYRDQLQAMYVDLTNSLYPGGEASPGEPFNEGAAGFIVDDAGQRVACKSGDWCFNADGSYPCDGGSCFIKELYVNPTNPGEYVYSNCNDDSNTLITPGANGPGVKTCYLDADNGYHNKTCADRGGFIDAQLTFDSSGKVHSFILKAGANSGSAGFGIRDFGFDYKPLCSVVARVTDVGSIGLTKADTELVNNFGRFGNGTSVPPTTSSLPQACRPWGAIGSQTQDPPNSSADLTLSTRWTAVALIPVPRDNSGTPIPPAAEVTVNQCTDISYRQGSGYTNNPLTPAPIGRFLSSLFRRVSQAWNFTPLSINNVAPGGKLTQQQYGLAPSLSGAPAGSYFDYTATKPPAFGPRIGSVDTTHCGSNGVCPVRRMNTVDINGTDSGILTGQGGVFVASMEFYAWASNSSMPVRSSTVAWGDTVMAEPPATGWYKNSKPYCSPDESDTNAAHECAGIAGLTCRNDSDCPGTTCQANATAHFGNIPGACQTTPYTFQHTYTCTLGDLGHIATTCAINAQTGLAAATPCSVKQNNVWTCIYQPRVQVVDNWGWCSCTGSSCQISNGAFGNANCDMNASHSPNALPWVSFGGQIKVVSDPNETAGF